MDIEADFDGYYLELTDLELSKIEEKIWDALAKERREYEPFVQEFERD